MKILRWLASLLVLGPLVGVIGTVYGMLAAFTAISASAQQPSAESLARFIQIALYTTFFGILVFPFGVVLHAVVARKTGTYSRRAWILILVMSILLCFAAFPSGTVLGVATIVLLFTLKTFRRMLRNEQPARSDSPAPPSGAPSGTPEQ